MKKPITAELVTVIRRRVVYEECVMTLEEFNGLNEYLKTSSVEEADPILDDLNDNLEDSLVDTPHYYAAVRGDLTSHVGDIIRTRLHELEWASEYNAINMTKGDY